MSKPIVIDLPYSSDADRATVQAMLDRLFKHADHLHVVTDTLYALDGCTYKRIRLEPRKPDGDDEPPKAPAPPAPKKWWLRSFAEGALTGLAAMACVVLIATLVRVLVEAAKLGWTMGGLWP